MTLSPQVYSKVVATAASVAQQYGLRVEASHPWEGTTIVKFWRLDEPDLRNFLGIGMSDSQLVLAKRLDIYLDQHLNYAARLVRKQAR